MPPGADRSLCHRALAVEHGPDTDGIAASYRDPASRTKAESAFREPRRLGIDTPGKRLAPLT